MSNAEIHRLFIAFGERHGILKGGRLALDIGMLDEQACITLLEIAYMAGMRAGAEQVCGVVERTYAKRDPL